MSALKILQRHREELEDLLADERPALQLVGGRRYVAELLVAVARAEAHEEWHLEGQVPELVPASNAEVERMVRSLREGAHAVVQVPTPARVYTIPPEVAEHLRASLAGDGRQHQAQVKHGPSHALICGCVTGPDPVVCPRHDPERRVS